MNPTLLTPADDLRHPVAAGEKGRDSLFYTLVLAEHGLWVFIYSWVDATGEAGRLVIVTDSDGPALVHDGKARIDMGASDFDAWSIDGLEIRHTDLLKSAEVRYAGKGAEVAFDFTGTHEAFDYARNPIGCPQWMAANRMEQTGRAQGELTVAGRTIAFDAPMHRDHSWGVRDWRMPQHWKWLCAHTESGAGLNVFEWIARGERGVNGYVLRDGEPVGLTDMRCEPRYDADMTNRGLTATLTDETGATTELELDRFAHMPLPVGSGTVMNEAGCHARIDGEAGAGQFEAQWPADYVEHLRCSIGSSLRELPAHTEAGP